MTSQVRARPSKTTATLTGPTDSEWQGIELENPAQSLALSDTANTGINEHTPQARSGHLENQIRHQMHLAAVSPPHRRNPFHGNAAALSQFWQAVENLYGSKQVPHGYGLIPNEDGYTMYNELERLQGKRGGSKHLKVTLPQAVWQPRIILWVQALECLTLALLDIA